MMFEHTMPTAYRGLLHDDLFYAATTLPDKIAVHVGNKTCTYAQLQEKSDCLAAALQTRGLCRGDRVAIFMGNTIDCLLSIYAILKAGGVFLIINPQTKKDKLRFIANDCSVRHLVTDIHLANIVESAVVKIPSLTHVIVSGSGENL